MTPLLFEIVEHLPLSEKSLRCCAGCSDDKYNIVSNETLSGRKIGCWSYPCARPVAAKFQDGVVRRVMNCYHHKPVLVDKTIGLPASIKAELDTHDDRKMPFTKHDTEDLDLVLCFFLCNWEMRIELFDAFLSEYAKTGSLTEAIFFARTEWDV